MVNRLSWLILITATATNSYAIMGVDDAGANLKLFEILRTGQQTFAQMKDAASSLQEVNDVLGGKLPSSLMDKLGRYSDMGCDLDSLFGALSGDGGDPLSSLNDLGRNYGGTKDHSNLLYQKDYIKDKFFAKNTNSVSLNDAAQIRNTRETSADEAVINSIALSDHQVKGVQKDHAQFVELSKNVTSSDTVTYQLSVQTKMLQKAIVLLERLVLLQSQMLDLQAKQYIKGQPVVQLGKAKG